MHSAKFPHTPVCIAATILRISFGLSLVFVGINHYMLFSSFQEIVVRDLGSIAFLGAIWAYLLPGLMIVGGVLLILGIFLEIAAGAVGLALGSIPAGMLAKSFLAGASISDLMPAAINAFIWMVIFLLVLKFSSCCTGSTCCVGEESGGAKKGKK